MSLTMSLSPCLSNSVSLTLSLLLCLAHPHTFAHSLTLSLLLTLPNQVAGWYSDEKGFTGVSSTLNTLLTLCLSRFVSHTLTLAHTVSLARTLSRALWHSLSLSHTHSDTLSHPLSLTLPNQVAGWYSDEKAFKGVVRTLLQVVKVYLR